MYRITSKALSPYPIETTTGWITVPAMGSVIAELTDAQLDYVNGCGCYVVEAVSYKAEVAHDPVVKESLTTDPVETADSERDRIIAELTERGIEFDGRMGAKKLRNLLRANS